MHNHLLAHKKVKQDNKENIEQIKEEKEAFGDKNKTEDLHKEFTGEGLRKRLNTSYKASYIRASKGKRVYYFYELPN